MSRNALIFLAFGGSALLLAGAFAFQYIGGLAPCAMCLWQRWPHALAVLLGPLALKTHSATIPFLGALAAATSSGLGVYHTGVERGWWEGPSSCTSSGSGLSGLSGTDLLSLDAPQLVLCDEVAWEMLGLSMASWNALWSAGLVVLWLMAARRR